MQTAGLSYVMVMRATLISVSVLAFVVQMAICQNAASQGGVGTSQGPATDNVEPVAPYDDKLLRLSEVLGAVHYLRALCGADEKNKWRDIMSSLIEAEQPGPIRRSRLVASFNRGYRSFNGTYGTCTQSALLASERYMAEGATLASQITNRYGR